MSGTVENLTLIRPGMDASDYVTGAGKVISANEAMAASGLPLVAAGDQITTSQTKTTRAMLDGGAAYDRLRQQLDPAYKAAQQYAKATDTITAAVQIHGASQTQANVMLQQAALRYGQAGDAGDKFSLSTRQTSFFMRSMAVDAVGAFAAIAGGAPVMSVVGMEASRLGTQMLLSRQGFAVVRENWSAMIAAMGGGWAAAGIAGAVAITGALVYMGISAETAAEKIKTMQNQLSVSRTDPAAAATQVMSAARLTAGTTNVTMPDAVAAAQIVAASPQWQGTDDQMRALIVTALDLSVMMGTTVPAAMQKWIIGGLTDLGKTADDLAKIHLKGFDVTLVKLLADMTAKGEGPAAFALFLSTLQKSTAGANTNLTELQQSLKRLDSSLNGASAGGNSFATAISGTVNSVLAFAVDHTNRIIRNLDAIRQFGDAHGMAMGDVGATASGSNNSATPGSPGGRGTFSVSASGAGDAINAVAATMNLTTALTDFSTKIAAAESGGRQFGGPHQSLTTSPTRALGMMQVEPDNRVSGTTKTIDGTTFDLTNQTQNIQAGLTMLSQLFVQFKGDLSKVAVGYNAGPNALYQNKLSPETMTYLSKLGLNEPAHGTFAGGGIPTMAGEHTAAAAVATPAAVTAGGTANTGGFAPLSLAAATEEEAKRLNDLDARKLVNTNALDLATKSMTQSQAAYWLEADKGAGADQKAMDAAARQYWTANANLKDLTVAQRGLVSEQQKSATSATDTAKGFGVEAGAARTLWDVQEKIRLAGLKDPNGVDPVAAAAQLAAAQATLTGTFNDKVKAMTDATAAQERNIRATELGGVASTHAANAAKALAEAAATSVSGTAERTRQVEALTKAYDAQTNIAGEMKAASMLPMLKAESDQLDIQISLLGKNNDERTRELAILNARKAVGLEPGVTAAPVQQDVIDKTLSNANKTIQLQKANTELKEMQELGKSVADTLGTALESLVVDGGKASDVFDTLYKSLLKIALQASVIKPLEKLMSNVASGQDATKDVGGIFSLFGGHSASPSAATIVTPAIAADTAATTATLAASKATVDMTSTFQSASSAATGSASASGAVSGSFTSLAAQSNSLVNSMGGVAGGMTGLLGGIVKLGEGLTTGVGDLFAKLFGGVTSMGIGPKSGMAGASASELAAKVASVTQITGGSGGWLSDIGSGISNAASSIGSGISNVFSSLFSLFHEGGLVGSYHQAMRMAVNDNFLNAPRYASGLNSDEFAAILHRGERVLTERQAVSNDRVMAGLSAGASGERQAPSTPISIHVYGVRDPDSFKASAPQIMRQALGAQQRAALRNGG